MMTYNEAARQAAPCIDRLVEEKIEAARVRWSEQGAPDEWMDMAAATFRERLTPWRDAAVAQAARALSHPEAPSAELH